MESKKQSQVLAIIENKLGKTEANLVVQNHDVLDLIAGIPLKNLQMVEARQMRRLFQLKGEQFRAYSEMINQQIIAAKHDIKIQKIGDYQEIASLEVDLELEEAKQSILDIKRQQKTRKLMRENTELQKELDLKISMLEKEEELENAVQRGLDVKRQAKTRELMRENEELKKELELKNSILRTKEELDLTRIDIETRELKTKELFQLNLELETLELELVKAELEASIGRVKNPPESPKRKTRDDKIQEVTEAKHRTLGRLEELGVSEDSVEYKRAEQRFENILHNLMT